MTTQDRLSGKKILIVDDEPDVLDTLEEFLTMCTVSRASNFEEAKNLLETQHFDLAILDIMGVKGYALLELARQKGITAVMLTAHALTPDNVIKSHKKGAAFFIPKERMSQIVEFLEDVLDAQMKGRSTWFNWLEKLSEAYWAKRFGPDWMNKDKKFWEDLIRRRV